MPVVVDGYLKPLIGLLQQKISRARGVTPANQLRNLFIGQAAFFSFATALTGVSAIPYFFSLDDSRTTVSSSPGMAGRLTLSRALGLLKEAINLEDSCFVPARKSLLSGYLGVLHEATVIRLRRM